MILDSLLTLSDKQAVTTTAGSTNTVDFKQKTPNLGGSPTPLYAVMTVDETFTGLTSLTLEIQDSAQETSGFLAAITSAAIPLADLKAGRSFVLQLPMTHKRYVRGAYRVAGTATAGKVSLHIATGLQLNDPQPESPRVWSSK